MNRNRKLAYLALLFNVLLWGVAPPLVKLALPATTPFRWLFYRYLFAAPLSLPFIIYYLAKTKPSLKQILTVFGLELVGTTAVLAALYQGLNLTTATEASLISATAPLFVVLGGILFLKEKEEKREWFGLSLALAGTVVIALEPLASGNSSLSGSLLGNGLVLLQNILWAGYLMFAKKFYAPLPKLLVTGLSFWVGLISFYVLSSIIDPSPLLSGLQTPIVLISTLYMATFGSIIALTLYIFAQNLIEASEAAMSSYLLPLVSIPLAIWWLGDKLTLPTLIAIVLIATGVFLAEHRPHLSKKISDKIKTDA